jgi:geranyl-CoA carboxylase alpha subunit
MVAKLIAHAPTRDAARQRLMAGLAGSAALGVVTNQHFLQRCLAHPVFAAGEATTAFIGAHGHALLAPDDAAHGATARLAAWLFRLGAGSSLADRFLAPLRFLLDGRVHTAQVRALGGRGHDVRCDDELADARFELVAREGDAVRYRCDGVQEQAVVRRHGFRLLLHTQGRAWDAVDESLSAVAPAGAAQGDGRLRAAMTGRVIALLVAEGDTVTAGQPLLTLEAMKMEHVHVAAQAGRVAGLHVAVGAQVAARQLLAEIENEVAR